MKRTFLLIITLLAFNTLFAGSIDVERAREFGFKFVKANFEQTENHTLDLVYTMESESGEPCFYVFNVSDYGFVMVSATDLVRPILGYSEDGIFETDNIAPSFGFMMENYKEAITYAINEVVEVDSEIAAEWTSLEKTGKLRPAMRGEKVGPLCNTAWDQSWPYNYYCPELTMPFASNGRSVVGCVATAMSQIMRYWSYPTKGTGEHSYTPKDDKYGYPEQYANFGATTYDWANMPYSINKNSPQEQIEAVALISYHCGVAVDMMYDDDGVGAGAYSIDVPNALYKYFGYAKSTYKDKMVTTQVWDSYIREALEMHVPIFYSGTSKDGGGHAFVCDGFDENGLFHYNYGWSGSGDGFFASSAIDYPVNVGAIFDIMPKTIYENTASAPKNVTAVPADNNELSATISWTNPLYSINGSNLTEIEKMVVERSGEVIYEVSGVKPGEQMSFVDNKVPGFNYYNYSVYAVNNGAHGKVAKAENVGFGPTCKWQLILQSSAFQGMRGASVTVYNEANEVVTTKTTTNSTVTTYDLDMPLGKVKFAWNPADESQPTFNLTMIVKDYNGNTLFDYKGVSTEMPKGVFVDTINNCGYEIPSNKPYDLKCVVKNNSVVLSWGYSPGNESIYGFNVFRDGVPIALSKTKTFTDTNVPHGGHCYTVTALYNGGNSPHSNEACAVLTENCDPATNLRYELSPVFKPVIYWDKPASPGLTGFYVFRRTGVDGEWLRIKVLGPNKTTFTDNSVNAYDTWYYYKVQAYYEKIDCMSSPASTQENKNQYMLPFFYSETGVNDEAEQNIGVYPNPANEKVTVDAQNINSVSVVNVMGQKVYESTSVNEDKVVIDVNEYPSGIYMIHVVTDEYETTKRVSIAH